MLLSFCCSFMLPIVAKRRKLESTPAKSEKSVVENSENEVRSCLRWKEKCLNLWEFHGFVHSFCHQMLSLLKSALMDYCWIGNNIFFVLETEMELVGQNKQHYICIHRTMPVVLKTLTAPCVGGSILFRACFSAPGRPQLGTTEGRWIPRRIQKCIYLMRMSVRHHQVCKSWVFCRRTGFYACFQNSFCGIFGKLRPSDLIKWQMNAEYHAFLQCWHTFACIPVYCIPRHPVFVLTV